MKILARKQLTNALLGVCCYGAVQAQPAADNIGTKTLYTAPTAKPTPPPAGYEPVFINHVGRHGARHLTKPVNTTKGYQLLEKADEVNKLSATGKRLLNLLMKLDKLEQEEVKSISVEGMEEQQGLATRMYGQNEALFQNHTAAWEASITKEIRTKQTASAFIDALKMLTQNKDSVIYTINDTILRFYDLAPAYTHFEDSGSWQQNVAQLEQKWNYTKVVNAICSTIFSLDYGQQLSATQKEDFVKDVYGFYTILFSLKKEANMAVLLSLRKKADAAGMRISPDSLKSFFTQQQLSVIGLADRAEDYFVKGPGADAAGIQVKIAAPLLADFLNTTDAFIQSGKTPVQLRFSHAETIIPFAALLQLGGADKAVKSSLTFTDAIWNAAQVAPLSANIQWILYRSKSSGKYLVRFLLNEKETKVTDLVTKQFPYYDWQSVRTFYLKKLQQLHFGLSDNGYRYLQGLK